MKLKNVPDKAFIQAVMPPQALTGKGKLKVGTTCIAFTHQATSLDEYVGAPSLEGRRPATCNVQQPTKNAPKNCGK